MNETEDSHNAFHLTDRDLIYIILTAITSALSVVGGIGIGFIYFLLKDLRTSGRKILLYISVMDALTAFGNILGVSWLLCRTKPSCRYIYESMVFCKFHASLTIFSSISSFFWTVVMGTCLFVSIICNTPSFAKHHMIKFHLICWTVPVLVTTIALGVDVLGYNPDIASWCWIDPETPNRLGWEFFTGKMWEMMAYIATVVNYACVKIFLWKKASKSLARPSKTLKKAEQANRKLTFVPLTFIILRIWGSLRFLLGNLAKYNPPWIAYMQGFGDSAQGLANFVLYCLLTDTIRMRIMTKCMGRRNRIIPEDTSAHKTRKTETSAV